MTTFPNLFTYNNLATMTTECALKDSNLEPTDADRLMAAPIICVLRGEPAENVTAPSPKSDQKPLQRANEGQTARLGLLRTLAFPYLARWLVVR